MNLYNLKIAFLKAKYAVCHGLHDAAWIAYGLTLSPADRALVREAAEIEFSFSKKYRENYNQFLLDLRFLVGQKFQISDDNNFKAGSLALSTSISAVFDGVDPVGGPVYITSDKGGLCKWTERGAKIVDLLCRKNNAREWVYIPAAQAVIPERLKLLFAASHSL